MFAYPENTPIMIYGNSEQAQAAYLRFRTLFDVKGFITPADEKTICDAPAYPKSLINEFIAQGIKIVVVDGWGDTYLLLSQTGNLKIYDVFLPAQLFEYEMIDVCLLYKICNNNDFLRVLPLLMKDKKGALINGNCQIVPISKYLSHNEHFNKEYVFLQVPPAYLFNDSNIEIFKFDPLYKFISLFISQVVSYNNRFSYLASTEEIAKKLPPHCKKVIINNYWFKGYFPQSKNLGTKNCGSSSSWNDDFLEEMAKSGKSADEILNTVSKTDLASKEEMNELIRSQFEEMRRREAQCDIRMADYIEDHFREEILFYSTNHPVNKLLKESAIRILRFIGLYSRYESVKFKDEYSLDSRPMLKIVCEPIYPFVIKFLGLNSEEHKLSYSTLGYNSLDLHDYVKHYLEINCNIKTEDLI